MGGGMETKKEAQAPRRQRGFKKLKERGIHAASRHNSWRREKFGNARFSILKRRKHARKRRAPESALARRRPQRQSAACFTASDRLETHCAMPLPEIQNQTIVVRDLSNREFLERYA